MVSMPIFRKKINNLFISLKQYQDLTFCSLAFIFTLSIMTQLLGILIYYLLAISLGINIPFIRMGWIRSAVVMITMVPVSISGLGVREGALLFLLNPYGVVGEESLALSFLIFGITLLLIGALGGFIEGRRLLLPIVR